MKSIFSELRKENRKKAPGWTLKNQFFDLRICPDCNTLQTKLMVESSKCDNINCASVVEICVSKGKNFGKLMWTNENWD